MKNLEYPLKEQLEMAEWEAQRWMDEVERLKKLIKKKEQKKDEL